MVAVDVHPADFGTAAAKLLAAAQELGLPANVVGTHSDGLFGMGFLVPDEVAAKAGFADLLYPKLASVTVEGEVVAEKVEAEEVDAEEAEAEPAPPAPVKRGPGRPRKVVQE